MKVPAGTTHAGREPWYAVAGVFVVAWVALDLITGLLHPAPGVSPWYPGAGLTVVLLYRFGWRYAPAVVVAEAVRWLVSHTGLPFVGACLVGCVIAVVYAASTLAIRERLGTVFPPRRPHDAICFCVLAVLASALAAAGSVAVLVAFHEFPASAYASVWRVFWLGDAVGILAFAPVADLALAVLRGHMPSAFRRTVPVVIELFALAAIVVLGFVTFGALRVNPTQLLGFALTFAPLAFLSVRDGMRGAILGSLALDLALVATDAVLRPPPGVIAAGQLNAIVQTILATILGTLSISRASHRQQHRWLASHDPRTSLPNRMALERWLATESLEQLWIACIDLDHFGLIDAAMERQTADTILSESAERIAKLVPGYAFYGRFESHAFVVASTGTRADAVAHAQGILEAFRLPLLREAGLIRFTASIGLASGSGREKRALLAEAAAAMFEAKSAGGDRMEIFEPPPGLPRGPRLVSELVRARDRGEFVLYFQPIHRLSDMHAEGFEALLRWQHPTLGLLLPGAFLRALERAGMLDEIEAWVVHEAVAALSRLPGENDARVWVNLSGRAAFDSGFVDTLPAIARAAGLSANRIVIEVSEEVVAGSEWIAEATQRIHDSGVGVAVDDFGAGQSTIDRIRVSRLDYLKIDRSFASGITSDERARRVALSIVAMAEGVGAEAVAEGLETQGQIDTFREGGCRLGQGFALTRPMDETSLQAFFSRGGYAREQFHPA